jgi:hypothetical protein
MLPIGKKSIKNGMCFPILIAFFLLMCLPLVRTWCNPASPALLGFVGWNNHFRKLADLEQQVAVHSL